MRSSSVKTAIVAITISVTLIAVVPSAEARPAQTPETNVTQSEDGSAERPLRAIKRILRRLIGGVTANSEGTSVPIPAK